MPAERAARKPPTPWTPAEEAIWNELAIKCLETDMLAMVRGDGGLAERNHSLTSHLRAMVKGFKAKGK